MERTLHARIEGTDGEGRFRMILATEGEASDGDILSIRGGNVPDQMPLLSSHWNDPSAVLGSVTQPRKDLKAQPPELRAVGQIELEGDGVTAEIRRDLFHMIEKGHVDAVSIRWDEVPGKSVRRVNLPADHPAFVDEQTEKDWRKRQGVFFEEWTAREGSVVALGADPEALIGRAEETTGEVASFWRHMAQDAREVEEPEPEVEYHDVENVGEVTVTYSTPEPGRATDSETPADPPAPEAPDPEPTEPPTVPARPRVRWEPGEVARELKRQMAVRDKSEREELQALIDRARGRVSAWPTNPRSRRIPQPR